MTDGKDDPRAIIDGTNDLVDAVVDRLIAPKKPKPDKPTIKKPDVPAPALEKTPLDRLLDRVPAELRDKVTVQVGSTKVKRPGQEPKVSENQSLAIEAALDMPDIHMGSLKILGEDNKPLMHLAGDRFVVDKIGFDAQRLEQKQQLEAPAQTMAPAVEAPTVASEPILASSDQVATLTETIARLESRVAALEAKIEQKPIKLGNNIVGNWLNNQRDKLAEVVRTNVDKVTVRGHAIADKISATKQSVKDAAVAVADDVKQSIVDTKATIVESTELVRDVAVQGAQQLINDGMTRHYDAMDAMAGRINQSASKIADNARDVVENPSQAFFEKALQPVAQRMFAAAEKMPDKVTLDANGNKSVSVGPYTYSKEQSGIVMRREGEVVTPKNLTQKDVEAVDKMKAAFPKPEQKQQIAPPKITGPKHKVSV